jgi:hypothetical protein
MTTPTDALSRLLREAATTATDGAGAAAPDAPALWSRGRRVTWVGRAAAGALALALVVLVVATTAVMRAVPTALPAEGPGATFPTLVSGLFPGTYHAGDGPVLGVVRLGVDTDAGNPGADPGRPFVIGRDGLVATLPNWAGVTSGSTTDPGDAAPSVAPDGLRLLSQDGIVDLRDGSTVVPPYSDDVMAAGVGTRGTWSPDSRRVAVPTTSGVAVLDATGPRVLEPVPGDAAVLAAGWRDDTTLLGVHRTEGSGGFEVVSRSLDDRAWSVVTTLPAEALAVPGAPDGRLTPTVAYASPDGARLLLVDRPGAGAGGLAVLVDTATGRRVAFDGDRTTSEDAAWDGCDPAWQDGRPLRTSGGLTRPADGAVVMSFGGRTDVGCVALAGAELTGDPDPHGAGTVREEVWRVALPLGAALALVATVWLLVALRRSRRDGERFLPMIVGRLF